MSTQWKPKELRSIRGVRLVGLEDSAKQAESQPVRIDLVGHRIGQIRADGGRATMPAATSFDGRGLYAMPGLIDGHVHALGFLSSEVPGPFDLPWVFRQQKRNLAALIRSGITTARDMGAPLKLVRRLSREASRFEMPAPRLLYAGPMLTTPGGYPHYLGKLPLPIRVATGPIRVELNSAVAARRAVEEVAAAGASCVKMAYQSAGYDDGRTPLPVLPKATMLAVIEEAHRLGLKVALHNVYLKDLRALADVPFDSLEHVPIDDPMTESDIASFAQRGIPVSSTLGAYGMLDHIDDLAEAVENDDFRFEPKPRRFLRATYKSLRRGVVPHELFGDEMVKTGARWMRVNLRGLHEAGVRTVFGTDTGSGIGLPGCPVWEFRQLERAGFSRREILQSATSIAAEAIGRPELGHLKAGSTADILLLRRNPLDSIEAIVEVAAVIRDGRLVFESEENRFSAAA